MLISRAETVAKLKKFILEGTYQVPTYVSDSCQFLIRAVLKPVPTDRFSVEQIRYVMAKRGDFTIFVFYDFFHRIYLKI